MLMSEKIDKILSPPICAARASTPIYKYIIFSCEWKYMLTSIKYVILDNMIYRDMF